MEALDAVDAYAEVISGSADVEMAFTDEYGHMQEDHDSGGYVAKASRAIGGSNPSENIIDIREYDIPYYLRVAIDKSESDNSHCESDVAFGLPVDQADLRFLPFARHPRGIMVLGDLGEWRDRPFLHNGARGACRARSHGL